MGGISMYHMINMNWLSVEFVGKFTIFDGDSQSKKIQLSTYIFFRGKKFYVWV